MKTPISALTLATVLVLPLAASGQSYSGEQSQYRQQSGYGTYTRGDSPEARYCSALIDRYYTYVVSPYDEYAKRRYGATVGVAVAQCEQGNYAGGIPTLEKALTNAKVALPPRG
jgi:hypothetical protein